MLKDILKKLGVEHEEDISDEDAERLIGETIDAKNTRISELETEKETLSKDKEELTTSVEGYKSREENLSKELSDTKTELATTKGKLEQVTDLYKENFTKDSNEQDKNLDDKKFGDDVLQQVLDTK